MLGVTALKDWFDTERRRLDHQRAIKVQAIDEFQAIIQAMISVPASLPMVQDIETLHQIMLDYIQLFNASIVSIEALDPPSGVITDIYKSHNLVIGFYDEYFKTKTAPSVTQVDEIHKLTVLLKKHQIALNETVW